MEDAKTGKGAAWLCRVAGVLLLLLWLASMSLDDDHLCSSVPLSLGYAAVMALAVAAMVGGFRPARLTLTAWLGLGAGLFFLIRCLTTDMLSEIWRELPLILGAYVFYGAGYLMAQRGGGRALTLALVLGVLVNTVYLFLRYKGLLVVEALGRPSMSFTGPNTVRCALFAYPNFTAMFLMTAGAVLICRPLWKGMEGGKGIIPLLVGWVGVVAACFCDSRAVWALPPMLLASAWVLWAIIRLYSGKGIGYGVPLVGLSLFVGLGVLLGELFMGNSLLRKIISVDTHGRTELWSYLFDLLPQTPWYGHGAGATQWQLLPIVQEYFMPNYAHNDYLQAWLDYGAVGLLLVVVVLLAHLAAGFWTLASEDADRERRALVAACMLPVLSLMCCAMFDFVWHNSALVGLTAFACGVMASPIPGRHESFFSRRKWAAGSRPSLRPVKRMGQAATALCCIACVALAAGCTCFGLRLLPAWVAQWEYNALCHRGAGEEERAAFLEAIMPTYPDPELVDHYVTLHFSSVASRVEMARQEANARKETMMRLALQSNPHQLYTVAMLSDLLARMGRHDEAESLLREKYRPGGWPRTLLVNWPAYYGRNLLMWGHQRLEQGDLGSALSMMEYALNIYSHVGDFSFPVYIVEEAGIVRNKALQRDIAARRVDVDALRAIGVQKDDSWKKPLHPGGQPALYAPLGETASSRKLNDPYARRSPLNL